MTDEEKQTLRNALSDAAAYKDQWEAIRAERDALLMEAKVSQARRGVLEAKLHEAESDLKTLKANILYVVNGEEEHVCECEDPECPYHS